MKGKKILASILMCTLLATVAGGCSSLKEKTAVSTGGTASITTSSTEGTAQKKYPIVDKKVTYKMIIATGYLTDPNKEVPFFQMMEDLTNVHFDFEIISGSDLDTKKAVIWASGDLPDFFTGAFTSDKDIMTYGPQGGFLVLNDYMNEKYMPNFMAVTKVQPTIKGSVTTNNGKIYGFPYMGAPNMTSTTAVTVNNSWLEALNLKLPTTLDEYVNVLKAFSKYDANGNGKADEIAFTYDYSTPWSYLGAMSAWFGVGTTTEAMIKKGVVSYSPVEEGWRTYVKFLRSLWKDGLMDKELFTQGSDTFKSKGMQKLYGSVIHYSPEYFCEEGYSKNYKPVGPFNGGTKDWGAFRDRPDGSYTVLARGAISSTCKNPEALVRWVDTLYDEKYCAQSIYGMIGTHVDLDKDNAMVIKPTPDKYKSNSEWKNYTTFNQIPGFIGKTYVSKILGTDTTRTFQSSAISQYSKNYVNELLPYNYQTTEETKLFSEYITDLNKYASQMFAAWVSGERDIDADWNSYLLQMKTLGVDKYVSAFQKYHDRIKALMK